MTNEEANRIIAEFMGFYFIGMEKKRVEDLPCMILSHKKSMERVYKYPYTESLDALVPVWDKLHEHIKEIVFYGFGEVELIEYCGTKAYTVRGNNKFEAAAHATAKAIKELNNA